MELLTLSNLPEPRKLKRLLKTLSFNNEDELISTCNQLLYKCKTPSHTEMILSTLACSFCHDINGNNSAELSELLASCKGESRICGKVFEKDEIVWHCAQCGKDGTCVQCDACFKLSNHEGHDVFFHRSASGLGCCDCGDPDAWRGGCSIHCEENFKNSKNISKLPPPLEKGLKAVLITAISYVVSASVSLTRGFHFSVMDYPKDLTLVGRLHNDDIHTYDDVINALTDIGKNRTEANTLTEQVDRLGRAVVREGPSNAMCAVLRKLGLKAGLLFSAVPKGLDDKGEATAADCMTWVSRLASGAYGGVNDAVRSIIAQVICQDCRTMPDVTVMPANEYPDCPSPRNCMDISNDRNRESNSGSGVGVGARSRCFPLRIPFISCGKADGAKIFSNGSSAISDTDWEKMNIRPNPSGRGRGKSESELEVMDMYRAMIFDGALGGCYSREERNIDIEAYYEKMIGMPFYPSNTNNCNSSSSSSNSSSSNSSSSNSSSSNSSSSNTRNATVDSDATTAMDTATDAVNNNSSNSNSNSIDDDNSDHTIHLHRVEQTQFNLFPSNVAILAAASPFVNKELSRGLCELVVHLQHEPTFKVCYCNSFKALLPTLSLLYSRGIGTRGDSIFETTVQIFTSDSVVEMLSVIPSPIITNTNNTIDGNSDSDNNKIHYINPPDKIPSIANVLVTSLLIGLVEVGCLPKGKEMLNYGSSSSATMTNRSMSKLSCFRSFGFISDSPFNHNVTRHRRFNRLLLDIEYVLSSPEMATMILQGTGKDSFLPQWIRIASLLQGADGHRIRLTSHIEQQGMMWKVVESFLTPFYRCTAMIFGSFLMPTRDLPNDIAERRLDVVQNVIRLCMLQLSQSQALLTAGAVGCSVIAHRQAPRQAADQDPIKSKGDTKQRKETAATDSAIDMEIEENNRDRVIDAMFDEDIEANTTSAAASITTNPTTTTSAISTVSNEGIDDMIHPFYDPNSPLHALYKSEHFYNFNFDYSHAHNSYADNYYPFLFWDFYPELGAIEIQNQQGLDLGLRAHEVLHPCQLTMSGNKDINEFSLNIPVHRMLSAVVRGAINGALPLGYNIIDTMRHYARRASYVGVIPTSCGHELQHMQMTWQHSQAKQHKDKDEIDARVESEHIFNFDTHLNSPYSGYSDEGKSRYIRVFTSMLGDLVEQPLRCFAWNTQQAPRMWVRNGDQMHYLNAEYTRVPFCKSGRDNDLTSLQLGLLGWGPTKFMTALLLRCEMVPLVFGISKHYSGGRRYIPGFGNESTPSSGYNYFRAALVDEQSIDANIKENITTQNRCLRFLTKDPSICIYENYRSWKWSRSMMMKDVTTFTADADIMKDFDHRGLGLPGNILEEWNSCTNSFTGTNSRNNNTPSASEYLQVHEEYQSNANSTFLECIYLSDDEVINPFKTKRLPMVVNHDDVDPGTGKEHLYCSPSVSLKKHTMERGRSGNGGYLMSETIAGLIQVVVYTPAVLRGPVRSIHSNNNNNTDTNTNSGSIPNANHVELDCTAYVHALKSAVTHVVLGGSRNRRDLDHCLQFFPDDIKELNSETYLRIATDMVCIRRSSQEADMPDRLELKPEALDLYDPEYPFLREVNAQTANEEYWRLRRNQFRTSSSSSSSDSSSSSSPPLKDDKANDQDKKNHRVYRRPLVAKETVPATSDAFRLVRNLLYHEDFVEFLRANICYVAKIAKGDGFRALHLHRIIHLLTLQIHLHEECKSALDDYKLALPETREEIKVQARAAKSKVVGANLKGDADKTSNNNDDNDEDDHDDDDSFWGEPDAYFNSLAGSVNSIWGHVSKIPIHTFSYMQYKQARNLQSQQNNTGSERTAPYLAPETVLDESLPLLAGMIEDLCRIYDDLVKSNSDQETELSLQGSLEWVLLEFGKRNRTLATFLRDVLWHMNKELLELLQIKCDEARMDLPVTQERKDEFAARLQPRERDNDSLTLTQGMHGDAQSNSPSVVKGADWKRKQMESRRRKMEAIQRQASLFMANQDEDFDMSDGDIDEDEDYRCIVCQEGGHGMGLLCFVQPSTMCRNALLQTSDTPELDQVYRVVAQGVILRKAPRVNAPIICKLRQSTHVKAIQRWGRWMYICMDGPCPGWAPTNTTATTSFISGWLPLYHIDKFIAELEETADDDIGDPNKYDVNSVHNSGSKGTVITITTDLISTGIGTERKARITSSVTETPIATNTPNPKYASVLRELLPRRERGNSLSASVSTVPSSSSSFPPNSDDEQEAYIEEGEGELRVDDDISDHTSDFDVDDDDEEWRAMEGEAEGFIGARRFNKPELDENCCVIPVLQPIKSMMFSRFGGVRVHITTCGHAIHSTCRDKVFGEAYQEQDRLQQNCIEPEWGDFLCPLCRTVCNHDLPILPSLPSLPCLSAIPTIASPLDEMKGSNEVAITSNSASTPGITSPMSIQSQLESAPTTSVPTANLSVNIDVHGKNDDENQNHSPSAFGPFTTKQLLKYTAKAASANVSVSGSVSASKSKNGNLSTGTFAQHDNILSSSCCNLQGELARALHSWCVSAEDGTGDVAGASCIESQDTKSHSSSTMTGIESNEAKVSFEDENGDNHKKVAATAANASDPARFDIILKRFVSQLSEIPALNMGRKGKSVPSINAASGGNYRQLSTRFTGQGHPAPFTDIVSGGRSIADEIRRYADQYRDLLQGITRSVTARMRDNTSAVNRTRETNRNGLDTDSSVQSRNGNVDINSVEDRTAANDDPNLHSSSADINSNPASVSSVSSIVGSVNNHDNVDATNKGKSSSKRKKVLNIGLNLSPYDTVWQHAHALVSCISYTAMTSASVAIGLPIAIDGDISSRTSGWSNYVRGESARIAKDTLLIQKLLRVLLHCVRRTASASQESKAEFELARNSLIDLVCGRNSWDNFYSPRPRCRNVDAWTASISDLTSALSSYPLRVADESFPSMYPTHAHRMQLVKKLTEKVEHNNLLTTEDIDAMPQIKEVLHHLADIGSDVTLIGATAVNTDMIDSTNTNANTTIAADTEEVGEGDQPAERDAEDEMMSSVMTSVSTRISIQDMLSRIVQQNTATANPNPSTSTTSKSINTNDDRGGQDSTNASNATNTDSTSTSNSNPTSTTLNTDHVVFRTWNPLLVPLLEQDMSTVMVTVVGLSKSVDAAKQLCSLCILGRLAQILISPVATGVGSVSGRQVVCDTILNMQSNNNNTTINSSSCNNNGINLSMNLNINQSPNVSMSGDGGNPNRSTSTHGLLSGHTGRPTSLVDSLFTDKDKAKTKSKVMSITTPSTAASLDIGTDIGNTTSNSDSVSPGMSLMALSSILCSNAGIHSYVTSSPPFTAEIRGKIDDSEAEMHLQTEVNMMEQLVMDSLVPSLRLAVLLQREVQSVFTRESSGDSNSNCNSTSGGAPTNMDLEVEFAMDVDMTNDANTTSNDGNKNEDISDSLKSCRASMDDLLNQCSLPHWEDLLSPTGPYLKGLISLSKLWGQQLRTQPRPNDTDTDIDIEMSNNSDHTSHNSGHDDSRNSRNSDGDDNGKLNMHHLPHHQLQQGKIWNPACDTHVDQALSRLSSDASWMENTAELGANIWCYQGVLPVQQSVDNSPLHPATLSPDLNTAGDLSFAAHGPFVASITGQQPIYALDGCRLSHSYPDLSCLPLGTRHSFGLIRLPRLFTDLFPRTKRPEWSPNRLKDPALCLCCGQVVSAANRPHMSSDATRIGSSTVGEIRDRHPDRAALWPTATSSNPINDRATPGECTRHSIECGAGIGCFLLTDRLQVLLIRGAHMCTYPSIYVDKNGEVETLQHSNKPLYLSMSRYHKLAKLYASHGIADYVVRKRSTEDRVLRPNWF